MKKFEGVHFYFFSSLLNRSAMFRFFVLFCNCLSNKCIRFKTRAYILRHTLLLKIIKKIEKSQKISHRKNLNYRKKSNLWSQLVIAS